jgi:hypothetical protein
LSFRTDFSLHFLIDFLQTVAVWEYDKRPAHGSSFVYCGMRLLPCQGPREQALIEYVHRCLGKNQFNDCLVVLNLGSVHFHVVGKIILCFAFIIILITDSIIFFMLSANYS